MALSQPLAAGVTSSGARSGCCSMISARTSWASMAISASGWLPSPVTRASPGPSRPRRASAASPAPARASAGRGSRAAACRGSGRARTRAASMAGRSRWFVGSSSTSRLTPSCWKRASAARVRSPGERDAGGRVTSSPDSPNLASSVRTRRDRRARVPREERVDERGVAVHGTRAWSISPITTPIRAPPCPRRCEGAEEQRQQRGLARPVGAGDGHAVAVGEIEGDRPEREVPAAHDGVAQRRHDRARAGRPPRSSTAAPTPCVARRRPRAAPPTAPAAMPCPPAARLPRPSALRPILSGSMPFLRSWARLLRTPLSAQSPRRAGAGQEIVVALAVVLVGGLGVSRATSRSCRYAS